MKWLRTIWGNKKTRYTALAVLVVIVLLAAGVSVWMLKNHYKQSTRHWQTSLHTQLEESGKRIETAKDSNEVVTILDGVQKTFNEWSAPSAPQLLGVSLVSSQVKQASEAAKSQSGKVSAVISDIKALSTYQVAVIKPLTSMSGKSADNLEQLKKLEGDWRSAVKTIADATPPEKAKAFHQSLTSAVDGVLADLAALIPLFEKKDIAGFEAKEEEFSSKIDALQKLDDQFANLAKSHDEALATALHELDHKLTEIADSH